MSVSAVSLRQNLRVTPVCRCLHPFAGGRIWLRQESLRHILASPGYAPRAIAVNLHGWKLEREFNACQAHRIMYPSIFNRFPVIQPVSSKLRHFSKNFFAHFGLPWVSPWDNRGKCYTDGKRIQCLSNASHHVPIYVQPFPSNLTRNFKSSPF